MDILIEEFKGGYWAAALKDGRIEGIEIDPPEEQIRWGDVYFGRVRRIDKASDAAIIEIDKDIFGYLNAADVYLRDEKREIYKISGPIGKSLETGAKVIVQAKQAAMDVGPEGLEAGLENKYARLSMDIAIQGRYMIFTPFEAQNRISQRIRQKKLREQLVEMLDDMTGCQGCILRASALNTQTDILKAESDQLNNKWDRIEDQASGSEKPRLLASGPNAVERLLCDMAQETIDRVSVVTMDHLKDVQDWCEIHAPDLVTKIQPVEIPMAQTDLGLFEYLEIIGQIEALFHPYCILEDGGSIIIQETVALTAIDVNRGSDKQGNLAINVKAAREIARQIRLRNIGGIITCDFLKMNSDKDRRALKKTLQDLFEKDPCTVQFHGYTPLGLVELTRQRRAPSLQNRIDHIEFSG